MRIDARPATHDDLELLADLYHSLEEEMVGLHAMWPIADGLEAPIEDSLRHAIDTEDSIVLIGMIDDYPFGFLLARLEDTHVEGERIGSIRLIYVEEDARAVAVGESMRETVLEILRGMGIRRFDAHVLPGHRLAKNFFESGGFSARSIVMFHDDDR